MQRIILKLVKVCSILFFCVNSLLAQNYGIHPVFKSLNLDQFGFFISGNNYPSVIVIDTNPPVSPFNNGYVTLNNSLLQIVQSPPSFFFANATTDSFSIAFSVQLLDSTATTKCVMSHIQTIPSLDGWDIWRSYGGGNNFAIYLTGMGGFHTIDTMTTRRWVNFKINYIKHNTTLSMYRDGVFRSSTVVANTAGIPATISASSNLIIGTLQTQGVGCPPFDVNTPSFNIGMNFKDFIITRNDTSFTYYFNQASVQNVYCIVRKGTSIIYSPSLVDRANIGWIVNYHLVNGSFVAKDIFDVVFHNSLKDTNGQSKFINIGGFGLVYSNIYPIGDCESFGLGLVVSPKGDSIGWCGVANRCNYTTIHSGDTCGNIAISDGTTWSGKGIVGNHGFNGETVTVTHWSNQWIGGGLFSALGNGVTPCHNLGTLKNGKWDTLGAGTADQVNVLDSDIVSGRLLIGGLFVTVTSKGVTKTVNGICTWNDTTGFDTLTTLAIGGVWSIAQDKNFIYIGTGISINRYNRGTKKIDTLLTILTPNPVGEQAVYTMILWNGSLWIGGAFGNVLDHNGNTVTLSSIGYITSDNNAHALGTGCTGFTADVTQFATGSPDGCLYGVGGTYWLNGVVVHNTFRIRPDLIVSCLYYGPDERPEHIVYFPKHSAYVINGDLWTANGKAFSNIYEFIP